MKYPLRNLVLLFSLATGIIYGQPEIAEDPYMKFDHLTKKQGLSNNYVLDILQDKNGFIWIATVDGLNKFDGYKITNYNYNPEDSTSLKGNLVTCLELDQDGVLWIGTRQGLCQYNHDTDAFNDVVSLNSESTNDWKNDFIRALLADENNILWIETAAGELVKYDRKQNHSKSYMHYAPTMVNTYFYHDLYKDKDGVLWLGGRFMGIFSFDPEKELFNYYEADENNPSKKRERDVAVYFQDSQNQFWIAGIDGLYHMNPKSEIFEKQLPISTFSITEDQNKSLWIGTGSGLYHYNSDKNSFAFMDKDDNNPNSLIADHINKVYIDRNQNIWIATTNGISIHRPSKNKFRHIYHITGDDRTPISSNITSILQINSGDIWIGTDNGGINCLNENYLKTNSYTSSSRTSKGLNSNRISVMKEDSDGDIWVGQWSGRGFNIIDPETKNIASFSFLKNSLKADWYNDFYEDSKGNYWVGLWGALGLYQFDKEYGSFKDESFQLRNYPGSKVKHLHYDGINIWLGLKNQTVLFTLNPVTEKINLHLKNHYSSFGFNQVQNIISDDQNRVWFQTNNGYYLKKQNPYITIEKTNFSPSINTYKKNRKVSDLVKNGNNDSISCSYSDEMNNIWAGTLNGLLLIQNQKITNHFTTASYPELGSDSVWAMTFVPPNQLWIGTEQGICKVNIVSQKIEAYEISPHDYLSSHLIKCIAEDNDENIWVGTTNKGLNILYPVTHKIKQFQSDLTDTSAFWGDVANCIFIDKKGSIWVGGYGLNKFITNTESFKHYTIENGLCDNGVMSIEEDNSGKLWIATLNGLSVFNPENETFKNYYEKDGLQDNEFSNASYKLKTGEILFGGRNGINICNPENFYHNDVAPPLAITSYSIFDKPHDIKRKSRIELDYDENYFSFEYTALDFSNPDYNQFAYKLVNADKDWIYTSATNRVAKYTNIDPGHYTFQVKGCNADGLWNEEAYKITVIVKPPFWKTTWFIILEILFLGLTIFSIIKYREKKIIEQTQFQLLEQKLLRSQMNPHFIFNSLSSIQSFIFENNPLEAGSYLSRFAELIRAILYNSREEFITLEKEIKTLQNYLDLQQLRYDHKFEYSLDIDPIIQTDMIQIPPMLAQPFVENAIEHGVKHLSGKGLISVSFTLMPEKGSLLLLVEDNGIGIKASKKLKKESHKRHTSLATIIANERIDVFNKGQKKKQFIMEIGDIEDWDGKIKGTKVKFIIPYREL